MLNLFPIQFLALFAYFLLRVGVGCILLYFGFTHLHHRKELSKVFVLSIFPFGGFTTWMFILIEIAIGLMFIVGFYTQIAALLTVLMSLKLIIFNKLLKTPLLQDRLFYTLLLFASLSLFITGAGAFAFDLPI